MRKAFGFLMVFLMLLAISPAAKAETTGVAMTKQWVIKFSQPVDPTTVNSKTVYVFNESAPNNRVSIEYAFRNDNQHIVVIPNGTYRQGNSYQLVVTDAVKSAKGKSLKAGQTKKFTVENGCDALKQAAPSDDYVIQISANGAPVHLGACTTQNGVSHSFNYSYSSSVDGAYFYYAGESAGYYFIDVNGQTMAVDKSLSKKMASKTISYYELKNGKFYHYVLNKAGKFEAIDSLVWPEFIEENKTYYSRDGVTFTDKTGKVVGTAYNYFQHISIRTKSNYTAAELNSYMKETFPSDSVMHGMGEALIAAQEKYHLNAMFMMAFAAHESSSGTNGHAKLRNNIYSLGIHDVKPDLTPYPSVADNLNKASEHIIAQYLTAGGTYSNGATLGNKAHGLNVKYATDPYWGEGLAKWMNRMDAHLGGKDKFAYDLGIIDSEYNFLNIRDESLSNAFPYKHVPSNGRGVTIIGERGTYYELIGDYGLTPGKVYGTKQYIVDGVKAY